MTEVKQKEQPIIVGLDIGTTKIVAIVGQQDSYGKIKILGIGKADSLGVARGEVVNIDKTVEAINIAVAEAERQSNVAIKSVYVGIAGEHISSKQNRGIYTLEAQNTIVTDAHIRAMIADMERLALNPGERIIKVLPQEFILDGNKVSGSPKGMCGTRLEADFHIITGKVSAAQNIKTSVEMAGLTMAGIILEPLASSDSVLSDDEFEAGVALVDIGGGTTDIAIFQENTIRHTAVIPFAGNIITEDIKTGCMVLKKQAEKLKTQFGSALPEETHENEIISIQGIAGRDRKEISMKMLSNVIHSRLDEIFQQVMYEIKCSNYSNKLIAGIVITGGGSQMKNLKQFVEYQTGLSARIGYPTEYLAKDTPALLRNPMYATAIGLILQGIEDVKQNGGSDNFTFQKIEEKKAKEIIETPEIQETEVYETPNFQEEAIIPEAPKVNAENFKEKKSRGLGNFWGSIINKTKYWFEESDANNDFE